MNYILPLICCCIVGALILIPFFKWYSKENFNNLDKMYNHSDNLRIIDSNTKSDEIANLVTVYAPDIDFNVIKNKIKELLDE